MMIGILAICSCTKTSTTAGPAGYWNFLSNSFQAVSCTVNPATASLTGANSQTSNPYGTFVVSFHDSLPTVGGTYTVVYAGGSPKPQQVTITVGYFTSDTSIYYGSTGGDQQSQKVIVTVNKGKISLSGSNIEIINTTGLYDSIPMNFSLTQQ